MEKNIEESLVPKGLKTDRTKAIIFMNLFVLFFQAYLCVVKLLTTSGVHVLDLCLIRSTIGFPVAFCMLKFCFREPFFPEALDRPSQKLLLIRSVCGLFGYICFVVAVPSLPLGIFTVIDSTKPIWAAILGLILNKEYLSLFEILTMAGSFAGIVVIAVSKDSDANTSDNYLLGIGLVLIASVTLSAIGVLTRQLQHLHYLVQLAHYQLFAMLALAVIVFGESLFLWKPLRLTSYSFYQWKLLVLASALNSIFLQFQTIAFKLERTGFLMLIGYIGLIYAFLADIFIFKESFAVG